VKGSIKLRMKEKEGRCHATVQVFSGGKVQGEKKKKKTRGGEKEILVWPNRIAPIEAWSPGKSLQLPTGDHYDRKALQHGKKRGGFNPSYGKRKIRNPT